MKVHPSLAVPVVVLMILLLSTYSQLIIIEPILIAAAAAVLLRGLFVFLLPIKYSFTVPQVMGVAATAIFCLCLLAVIAMLKNPQDEGIFIGYLKCPAAFAHRAVPIAVSLSASAGMIVLCICVFRRHARRIVCSCLDHPCPVLLKAVHFAGYAKKESPEPINIITESEKVSFLRAKNLFERRQYYISIGMVIIYHSALILGLCRLFVSNNTDLFSRLIWQLTFVSLISCTAALAATMAVNAALKKYIPYIVRLARQYTD